ncbi:MAG: stage II sporulation protein M [Deltaproteobacteria bacterium]
MSIKAMIKRHLKDNRVQYLLIILFFAAGVTIGGYKAGSLDATVRSHLSGLINGYLQSGMQGQLAGSEIIWSAFITQSKTMLLIWFLGLTVIGLPLILGVVFIRGLSLGFTLAFLAHDQNTAGIWIALVSILPQNLVYIPLLIVWSVLALNFSVYIVKSRTSAGMSLGRGLLGYTVMMLVFILLTLAGSLIEAYLSPWLLGLLL